MSSFESVHHFEDVKYPSHPQSNPLLPSSHSEQDIGHVSPLSDSYHSLNAEYPSDHPNSSQPPNNQSQNSVPRTNQPIPLKSYTCNYPDCDRTYQRESKLKVHQISHGIFRCTATKCQWEFGCLNELDAHRLVSFLFFFFFFFFF
jgi:hypothetical protein